MGKDRESPDAPFDTALEGIRQGNVEEALDGLVASLARLWRGSSAESWNRVVARARNHPLCEAIQGDPYVVRCYSKPRGYAPDGVALDYVLRARDLPRRSRDPLAKIHHYTTHKASAQALLFRRDAVAREIDACAARVARPARIFAAGAFHLREADRSTALRGKKVGRLVAFDTDAANLETVTRDYGSLAVTAHHGSIRQLAEGGHLFGDMDLVYSGGILETLPPAAAQGFARTLFTMVAPGGMLFITHFLSSLDEAGFLEAFLDWRMRYRNQAELFELVKELPTQTVSTWVYSESGERTLGVIAIQRR